jgi:hypothetical protein
MIPRCGAEVHLFSVLRLHDLLLKDRDNFNSARNIFMYSSNRRENSVISTTMILFRFMSRVQECITDVYCDYFLPYIENCVCIEDKTVHSMCVSRNDCQL